MAKFKKGMIPWNKGLTRETDKRVKKYGLNNRGNKRSEEIRKKISETTKKAMANPEIRKKISKARKGKPSLMKGKKTGIISPKRKTVRQMQEIAKSRGGECLSKKYVSSDIHLIWKCNKGHTWSATYANISRGTWCPECKKKKMGDYNRLNIQQMQKLAESKGGKCLSKKYVNNNTPLEWECKEGHVWKAKQVHISRGHWCPRCSQRIGERICRKYFEEIFDKKFSAIRPKWLKNKTGKNLELDGYCAELKLAFEYQGIQHYEENFYSKTRGFEKQKEADEIKKGLCKKKGIVLIEVPYTVEFRDMDKFIIKECKKNKIKVPKITKALDHRLFDIYSPQRLRELNEIAESHGGKCLSKRYINAKTKMKWKCKEGHVWRATSDGIPRGKWCPYCLGRKRTIKDMQKLAKIKGGKCLSKRYRDSITKLEWECDKGHKWKAIPDGIVQGSWCPLCARKNMIKNRKGKSARRTISEMQELAKLKGGRCLSKKYVNNKTNLKWKCDKGHIWLARPDSVSRGTWCPRCSKRKQKTLNK